MKCKSGIRSLIVQSGNIVAFTKTGVHLNNIGRVCMQASSENCEFRTSLRMMILVQIKNGDPLLMSYRRKMKRVHISVEAGKVKAENLVVAIQFQRKNSHHGRFF